MAMHLGRIIRCYANKLSLPAKTLCAERFPIGARCYSSRTSSPEPVQWLGGGTFLGGGAFLAWLSYRFDLVGLRTKHESSIADLHRRKVESVKAELETIERKIDDIKAKRCERARTTSGNRSHVQSRQSEDNGRTVAYFC